ncbi:unnamed protein product [Caenorhabditis angaria]|uniref:Uncharacterized protein n=1 Tax=Caenorhabditis angaria TaxID=860376 RepID=A0A9P1IZA7_9PELO|nr:unnamed protein product [Caenorhabditis angaria]
MGYNRTKSTSDLKRANLISLTDGLSTIIFELIPSIFFTFGIINILGVGPVTGTLRNMARSSEAFVMFILMKKQSSTRATTIQNVVSVSSRREGSHVS